MVTGFDVVEVVVVVAFEVVVVAFEVMVVTPATVVVVLMLVVLVVALVLVVVVPGGAPPMVLKCHWIPETRPIVYI